MNILYIGELNEIGAKLCNFLSIDHNVIACSSGKSIYEMSCDYVSDCCTDDFISDNGIEIVIYFESTFYDVNRAADMMSVLFKNDTCRLLYIRQMSIFRHRQNEITLSEILCQEFFRRKNMPILYVEVSCLYGKETIPEYFHTVIKEISEKNKITPHGAENEFCDAMYIDDFCLAVSTLLNENETKAIEKIELKSGYPFKLQTLMDAFKQRYSQITINPYEKDHVEFEYSAYHSLTWSPKNNMLFDLPMLFSISEAFYNEVRRRKRKKLVNNALIALSFTVVLILIELYRGFIAVSSDLQFVDLRLLLVVLSSLMFGLKYGIISACACSIASIVQSLLSGQRWYVLFFHVNNWIPIAVYFVVAIGISMYRRKEYERSKDI